MFPPGEGGGGEGERNNHMLTRWKDERKYCQFVSEKKKNLKYIGAGDRHVLDTNPVPAPSPTGSVHITEAKFPLLAVGGGGSSGHSWSSFHNSTHLSSHGNFIRSLQTPPW